MKIIKTIVLLFMSILVLTGCEKHGIDIETNKQDESTFLISFDTLGGTLIESVEVLEGKKVTLPNDPTKEGYVFNEWYIDYECTIPFSVSYKVNRDITLYAGWVPKEISIQLVYPNKTVEYKSFYKAVITSLPKESITGYNFSKFYFDSSFTTPFESGYEVTEDITLYAMYTPRKYEVSIIIDSETTKKVSLEYLSTYSNLPKVEKENCSFEGFYYDKEYTKPVNSDDLIKGNNNVYCKWFDTANIEYKVIYQYLNADGLTYTPIKTEVFIGALDEEVRAPLTTLSGYTLTSTEVKGTIVKDETLILHVNYTKNTYNITYYYGTTLVESLSDIPYQSTITLKKDYVLAGKMFRGWYTDKNLTKKCSLTKMPSYNLTLYAKFEDIVEGTQGLQYKLNANKTGYVITGYTGTITTVIIPNGYNNLPVVQVTSLSGSSVIKELIISQNITTISASAFTNCSNLTDITLPSTVTTDIYETFKGMKSLKNINVSSSHSKYYSVDGVLFLKSNKSLVLYPQGKDDLSYTVPSGTSILSYYCFLGNKYLEDVVISDTVTTILNDAFYNCSNLKSISIGKKVSKIDEVWLYNNPLLQSITVDKDNKYFSSVDGVLFNKDQTKLLIFPSSNNITSYFIPSSVVHIGYNSFTQTKYLEEVIVSSTVTTIDVYAFNDCLVTIYVDNTSLPSNTHPYAFNNIKKVVLKPNWSLEEGKVVKKEDI